MPTIDVAGSTLFYREAGEDTLPPLVLIHGLYSDSSSVMGLAQELGAHFHVVAPDMLGHGRSSRPEGFTLADQGRAVNGLVASLGHEAAAVVGISMGSYIAAQAAILEPARVSRLVLVTPKAHGTTSSVAAYAAREGIDLAAVSPEQIPALMAGAVWSPHTPPERREAIFAATNAEQIVLGPAEQAAVERSLAGFDLRPTLGEITAPTLVLSGRSDGLNPPEAGAEVARHIPGAAFVVYEDSGHMLPEEERARFLTDVTAFVRDGKAPRGE